MMKEKIALIGGGGHCTVIIDAIVNSGEYDIEGVVDPKLETGSKIFGFPILGGDDILLDLYKNGVKNAFISVGSVGNCELREILYKKIKDIGFNIATVVHPKAVVARDVKIGEGTFIAASATVNPGTKIGKNVIINTASSIDHDCIIGDFVHIAPGVTLSGEIKVGSQTHIGTGANVIQRMTIGKKCMVGAGLTLRDDLRDGQSYIKPGANANEN